MFVPFKTTRTEIEKLREVYGDQELPDVKQIGQPFYEGVLSKCKRPDGAIDGANLQSLNFPFDRENYDVFISHSHNDVEFALFLYAWLTERCGLSCFIDEILWNSADALLRQIDKDYCKSSTPGLIDYEKSLYSSSHVHTMLGMSMLDAINRSECCLFINSDNSVTLRDGIETGTLSPWIYQEVQFINHIMPMIPPRLHERAVRLFSVRVRDSVLCESAGDEQLKVEYAVDFSNFAFINGQDLFDLRGKGPSGLDNLYRKYVLKRRCPVQFRQRPF